MAGAEHDQFRRRRHALDEHRDGAGVAVDIDGGGTSGVRRPPGCRAQVLKSRQAALTGVGVAAGRRPELSIPRSVVPVRAVADGEFGRLAANDREHRQRWPALEHLDCRAIRPVQSLEEDRNDAVTADTESPDVVVAPEVERLDATWPVSRTSAAMVVTSSARQPAVILPTGAVSAGTTVFASACR